MFKVMKKAGKTVMAYRLGDSCEALEQMIAEGRIIARGDGTYEIMTLEAINGKSGKGEIVHDGDYVKVGSSGEIYPNSNDFFLKNHKLVSGNEYEQIRKPLDAWTIDEPMCEEIEFLVKNKGLEIRPQDAGCCFSAFHWGTKEAAARDAVIVFYSIERDKEGHIVDADFNFVARKEFEQTYHYVPPAGR